MVKQVLQVCSHFLLLFSLCKIFVLQIFQGLRNAFLRDSSRCKRQFNTSPVIHMESNRGSSKRIDFCHLSSEHDMKLKLNQSDSLVHLHHLLLIDQVFDLLGGWQGRQRSAK